MRRVIRAPAASFTLALLALFLTGCGQLGYYVQSGLGQQRVLSERRSITRMLAEEDLDDDTREQLLLVLDARRFAAEELGLSSEDSYLLYFDTHGRPISWVLSAAPPDRLVPWVWSFPIVGAVPYKGFFDRSAALEEQQRLAARGLETYLRGVPAFSTLGWFDDPVYSYMLEFEEADLVNVVIHELLHATAYLPGDTPFNESMATFVGNQGTIRFLQARYGRDAPEVAEYRRDLADEARFRGLMRDLLGDLEEVFEAGGEVETKRAARRQRVAGFKAEYRKLRRDGTIASGRWDGVLARSLSNPELLSFKRYHLDTDQFERILEECQGDLKKTVGVFVEALAADDPRGFLERYPAE